MRPLVDAGLVSSTSLLSATSITGYSGGGKKMIEQYEAGGDPRLAAPRPYGLTLAHKHVPEMMVHSRLETAPVFMPIVGNFYKGLSVSVPLHLSTLKRGTTAEQLHAALAAALCRRALRSRHAARRRVDAGRRLLRRPGVQRHQPRRPLRVRERDPGAADGRLDNLGKGASGAAVQSMNVHLGLDEGIGL